MVPKSARSSSAQPWTSPTANTVSPRRSNGAGFQSEISTGSLAVTVVSMAAMLALSGAALHCGGSGLGGPSLELLLHCAIEVVFYRPLIPPIDPDVGGQCVVAVADRLDADVVHPDYAFVALDQVLQAGDGCTDIVVGWPRVEQIDTRRIIVARHAHDLAPQLAVGDDDARVVVAVDLRVEQVDHARLAGDAASLDAVADVERPEQDQHDPGSKIAERALQGESDGDAECTQDGDEARSGDAEGRQNRHEGEHQRRISHAVAEEEHHGTVDARRLFAEAHYRRIKKTRGHPSDDQDDDGAHDAQAVGRDHGDGRVGRVGPLGFEVHDGTNDTPSKRVARLRFCRPRNSGGKSFSVSVR